MRFSIAVIARNEARTLPRLLASLADFQQRGGEIVVVDTGSTDGTPDIARKAGCRVFEVGDRFRITIDAPTADLLNRQFVVDGDEPIVKAGDQTFDFASARNYAASLPTHDFVAMPDCDEIFTAFQIDAVNNLLADETIDQIDSIFVFSHDQWGNDGIKFRRARFYHRRRQHWVGLQHEGLTGLDSPRRVLVDESIIRIEHWQNPQTNRGQYLTGLALDCHLHPESARNSHYFGRELYYMRRYRSAIREFERHIAMNAWPVERAQSYIYMGDCYGQLRLEQQQVEAYWQALQTDATRRAPLLSLARHYFTKGDSQRTACFAAAALEVAWEPTYANAHADYTSYPHELLYWAKWRLNDIDGARHHWQKALQYQPHNQRCLADARFFLPTPPVAVFAVIDGEGDPEALHAEIEKQALYPEFEMVVHHQSPGSNEPIASILRQMLPHTTAAEILFLEAGYKPGPGFLIQAVMASQSTGLVFLRDSSGQTSRACWLAPRALIAEAVEFTHSPSRTITDLLPIGTPFVVAEHATVDPPSSAY